LELREQVFDDSATQALFLSFAAPRSVFVKTLMTLISSTPETETLFNQTCEHAHTFLSFVPKIIEKFFNCFSKNFISTINDRIHEGRKRTCESKESQSSRKIAKLN
jgi:hypothetical protein